LIIVVGPEWAEHDSGVVIVLVDEAQDDALVWSEVGFKIDGGWMRGLG
jgi:hypothetical protein